MEEKARRIQKREETKKRLEARATKEGVEVRDLMKVTLSDLVIRNQEKQLVPLVPNEVQEVYLDEICPRWRQGDFLIRGLREIDLKARQEGLSTLIEALLFLDTINNPNTNTVVIAHDSETTDKIFRMVQLFYRMLPEEKKPPTQYASRKEFVWNTLNSSFYVGTAGAPDFGRGTTPNNIHGSEVASWSDPEGIASGLMEAVPEDGNIFMESTAKGVGNFFHLEYKLAKAGDSSYKARFFPWFWHKKYQTVVPEGFVRSTAEEELADRYGLVDEQLVWRRLRLRGPARAKFPQEFPVNDVEAFLLTGNPYFNRLVLSDRADDLRERGVVPLGESPEASLLAKAWAAEPSNVQIYRLPEPGHQYVVAADCAEGLTEEGDSDFDSAHILDDATWEEVAHVHGRWDPNLWGLMLSEIGWLYNLALVGVERNNHGHAVLNSLLYVANYPRAGAEGPGGVYFHEEWDERKKNRVKRPGWPTTVKTKFFGLDTLSGLVEENEMQINSIATLDQMTTFVHKAGGKAGGEGRSHDDRVMSLSIGAALLTLREKRGKVMISPPASEVRPRIENPVPELAVAVGGPGVAAKPGHFRPPPELPSRRGF